MNIENVLETLPSLGKTTNRLHIDRRRSIFQEERIQIIRHAARPAAHYDGH